MTANSYQGWRVEVRPDSTLRRTQAGRIGLPVSIMHSGEHVIDAEVIIPGDIVELLHTTLTRQLSSGKTDEAVEELAEKHGQ